MFRAAMALDAYRRVLTLSSQDRWQGDRVAMMDVLHTPPRASPRIRVSLESLHGREEGEGEEEGEGMKVAATVPWCWM